MSSIICPECGHDNQPDALYCDECGIDLPVAPPAETPLVEAVESSSVVEAEEVTTLPKVEEPVTEVPEEAIIAESEVEEPVTEAPEEEVIAESEVEKPVTEVPEEEVIAESEVEEPVTEAPEEAIIAESEVEEPLAIVSEEASMPEAISPEPVEVEEVEPVEAEEVEPVGAEEPAPFIPVSSATVLDWDEPEILPIPTEPTTLAVPHAFLIHTETESRFELPPGETMVYLGKVNEEMPIQVDLSELPDADVISRVHGVIHVEEEENYYLEDAGSLNGTSLNGEAVKPGARFRKQLKTGDIITLGRHRTINLTFEIQDAT